MIRRLSAFHSRRPPHGGAVQRCMPFALHCCTITGVRYTLHAHHPGHVTDRLRRVTIAARSSPTPQTGPAHRPGNPPQEF